MKKNNKLSLLWFFSLFCFMSFSAYAAPRAKPIVAIKEPKTGEGVSKYAWKNLYLNTICDEMEAVIQKNRKFNFVSRKKHLLQDIRDEQKFAKSELTAGDTAEEGQIKNANYLILPALQDFKFYRSSKPAPNLESEYFRTDSGMLEVNAQLIDTATS